MLVTRQQAAILWLDCACVSLSMLNCKFVTLWVISVRIWWLLRLCHAAEQPQHSWMWWMLLLCISASSFSMFKFRQTSAAAVASNKHACSSAVQRSIAAAQQRAADAAASLISMGEECRTWETFALHCAGARMTIACYCCCWTVVCCQKCTCLKLRCSTAAFIITFMSVEAVMIMQLQLWHSQSTHKQLTIQSAELKVHQYFYSAKLVR